MEILVQVDPDMPRSFVIMEAYPKQLRDVNIEGARALGDFLLAAKAQNFLLAFRTTMPTGMPLFYPVKAH